jgi:flavin-dependent dehydrogenase
MEPVKLDNVQESTYDCAIIGGGIAGLSLAICLAQAHKKVILFEKKNYPFHKVCGEYFSNESRDFLKSLGIDFSAYKSTEMTTLFISSPMGFSIKRPLDIGGIGLSRYELDNALYHLALKAGVKIHTNTQVNTVEKKNEDFFVEFSEQKIIARTVAGAYGKNSNLDVNSPDIKSNQHVAVKYHIKGKYNKSFVEIHNFPGGYCGMSSIEDDKINMSYICKASLLKKHKSIDKLNKEVVSKNPFLKNYFENATFVLDQPLTISKLHFQIKAPVLNHLLIVGDAAGNIAPLSGNGMSIALLSSKTASECILKYLNKELSFEELETEYTKKYYQFFSSRISIARKGRRGTAGRPWRGAHLRNRSGHQASVARGWHRTSPDSRTPS